MALVFLTFANTADAPLASLSKEDDEVMRLLSRRKAEKHIDLHRESHATLPKIAEYLIRFRDDIVVFHYSGHAGRDRLILEDTEASSEGIAKLLGLCPNLKLIILNGCSTKDQVENLLQLANKPLIVATSAPVEDHSATQFAISFYQLLCEQNANVQEAFDGGLAAAQLKKQHKIEYAVSRGLTLEGDTEADLWGLYTNSEEEALHWTLPAIKAELNSAISVTPNELLVEGLMKSLQSFVPEVAKILEDEAAQSSTMYFDEAENPFKPQKQKVIMQSFPYPVSNHLKALFSKRQQVLDGEVFFHEFNMPRLQRLIQVYLSAVELPAFFLIAQLWDIMVERKDLQLSESHANALKSFLLAPAKERRSTHLYNVIQHIHQFFIENDITHFFEEMDHVVDDFQLNSEFYNACQAMELIKSRVDNRTIRNTLSEVVQENCLAAENHVTLILQKLSFLANYLLVSVRNIDVFRNRRFLSPRFIHKVVRLEINMHNQAADPTVIFQDLQEFMHNFSILVKAKNGDAEQKEFLNLTPFIFDENAFIPKAPTRKGNLKLCYFNNLGANPPTIFYKHAFNFNDPKIAVGPDSLAKERKSLIQLKEQFDAFTEIVFRKDIRSL